MPMRALGQRYMELNDRHPAVAILLAVMLIVTPLIAYYVSEQRASDRLLCETAADTRDLIRDIVTHAPASNTPEGQEWRDYALARTNEPRCQ